jgi:hypothetical protein
MSQKGLVGDYVTAPGLLAGADLSSSQYYVVKLASTAGEVVAASAVSDMQIGLLQNDPADGEVAEVAIGGIARGKSGGTITVGQRVSCLSTGTLQGTSGGTASSQRIVGIAMEAASSGDLFSVMVAPQDGP